MCQVAFDRSIFYLQVVQIIWYTKSILLKCDPFEFGSSRRNPKNRVQGEVFTPPCDTQVVTCPLFSPPISPFFVVAHANYCDPFELGNDLHWCIPNVWTLRVSDYLSQLQANRSPPFKWHWCQKKERRIGSGVELCIPSLNTFALFAPSRFLRSCGVSLDPLMRFGGSRWLWEWPFLGTKSFPCIRQFRHLVYHIVNFVVWTSRSQALWWRSQCAHFATSQLHPMPTFKSSKFYGRVISPLFRFKDSRSPWYDWILQNYKRKYLAICVWMLASHMPSCEFVVWRN